jgi:hypothetical protein
MGIKKLMDVRLANYEELLLDLRKSLAAASHSLNDNIGVLHEHGDGSMLHRRRFYKAHGVHCLKDPF